MHVHLDYSVSYTHFAVRGETDAINMFPTVVQYLSFRIFKNVGLCNS